MENPVCSVASEGNSRHTCEG